MNRTRFHFGPGKTSIATGKYPLGLPAHDPICIRITTLHWQRQTAKKLYTTDRTVEARMKKLEEHLTHLDHGFTL